ncbi:uncharacterized protein A1O9_11052 [Exophiala aquamarina CBS 119918]|uniref:Fumarylacetoacetase n=1 Tax=Exophiala aquamarina CBS 119918 TaxID=1182545 RepID=A0A072P1J5_9EURO|nr:uncharacterized protein A1O9_11052 [Exophiala aquamarina CBS 119918]KEF53143.1 hypothetical protein A1O9_11052 [Exophiala aquamarina CBS 119918]
MGPRYPLEIPAGSPFPVQNIPYGVFSTPDGVGLGSKKRAGVAVGSYVLELDLLVKAGLFDSCGVDNKLDGVFLQPNLNSFATFLTTERGHIRAAIIKHLTTQSSPLFENKELNDRAFIPLEQVQMHLPMSITDYTDFFSSLVHAENGCRSLNIPIPQAFWEYPMAYNGRIGSVAISGTDVVRPHGFFKPRSSDKTALHPSELLDFEIEMGAFVSKPVNMGEKVSAMTASEHIFGYVLLNDWSARDIQGYEMSPFGPFHSKSFLTSISPWVVTLDALRGSPTEPPPTHASIVSPTLDLDRKDHGLFDVDLSARVSRKGGEVVELARCKMADGYWTPYQHVAYQSSSGCGLHTGDLLGTGTFSSPDMRSAQGPDEKSFMTFGCLMEAHIVGHKLPDVDGRPFTFLEDGDRLTIDGWFRTPDGSKAGFGGVTGLVLPPIAIS